MFAIIEQYINETHLSSLTRFQKFILTMMHLRLNIDFTELGYRFRISTSTASRIFSECLYVMHDKLYSVVRWPEREEFLTKTPLTFLEPYGRKAMIIVDCFEIKTEKLTSVLASQQCFFLHYKHHCTVKYLIAISSQGSIIILISR